MTEAGIDLGLWNNLGKPEMQEAQRRYYKNLMLMKERRERFMKIFRRVYDSQQTMEEIHAERSRIPNVID